jgi:hypothetical protein
MSDTEKKVDFTATGTRRNKNALKSYLENKAGETKDAEAKWYKDNPGRTPGWNPTLGWKTFSRQKYPSEKFVENYQKIDWSKG